MSSPRHILTLSCANRPGIVAKVSTALFDGGFNILDAQQFDDVETGDFFMRVVFNASAPAAKLGALGVVNFHSSRYFFVYTHGRRNIFCKSFFRSCTWRQVL